MSLRLVISFVLSSSNVYECLDSARASDAQPVHQLDHLHMEFHALPKPSPSPIEIGVIAYCLLDTGADLTWVILNPTALRGTVLLH